MEFIKALLFKTGWNSDELIRKVQEYKLQSNDETIDNIKNDEIKTVESSQTQNDTKQPLSVEIETDHSYTCRTTYSKKDRRDSHRRYVEEFLRRRKTPFRRKFNFLKSIRWRYKLMRKSTMTDRKPLICNYKSKERVRNEIMHQLELLRSKKTLAIASVAKQTSPVDTAVFSKKRYSGERSKEEELQDSNAVMENGGDSKDIEATRNTGIGQSQANQHLHGIKPTKTHDITKIKGWKRKKFASLAHGKIQNGALPTLAKNESSEILPVNNTQIETEEAPETTNSSKDKPENSVTSTNQNGNKTSPTTKADVESAFDSTNLDGFLHESANLHISFEIPTLNSNHNKTNPVKPTSSKRVVPVIPDNPTPSGSPVANSNGNDAQSPLKVDPLNLYRPRTLGQKRRIWKLRIDTGPKKKLEEAVPKPRTLAEKRRMLDNDLDTKNKPKVNETTTPGVNCKYSYVLYRGKKLRVTTRTGNEIIAYIKSQYGKREYIYVPKKIKQSKMKPSIFATIPTIQPQVLRYKPGPLSKKTSLQEFNKDWKTEIKTLPRIYLEVKPQPNKPISPNIRHLLPQYGFELTNERVSFALSTLPTNNRDSFTFPIPYANKQEYILLRRKIKLPEGDPLPSAPVVKVEDEKTVEEIVQNVLDKMLDYVETKVISEEVVREDVTEKFLKEEKASANDQEKNIARRRKTKQSKTNYELKRLNVKVIEVNLEDKGDMRNCKKDFCRLGCVCQSLSTTSSLVSNHCGVPDCMFKCQCNYEKKSKGNLKVTLPIGTDLLSEGAVNRLEVEAKKNLAKVEKEFTQTVIQANNQTIVVGGCTNRQRRVTKLPKKYTDFIEDPDDFGDIEQIVEEEVEPPKEVDKLKGWKPLPCTVFLTKLNLDQIVPYCMVHNLYDCYCDYQSGFDLVEEKKKEVKKDEEAIPETKLEPESMGPVSYYSARTKGIPTSYYLERNKSERFQSTRKRKLQKTYKDFMRQEEKCIRTDETEHLNVDVVEDEPTDNSISCDNSTEPAKEVKRRRKQNLTIRRDTSPIVERALQRRKKYMKIFSVTSPEQSDVPPANAILSDEKIENYQSDKPEKTQELQERIAKFEQIFQTTHLPSSANLFTPSALIQEKLSEILGRNVGTETQYRLIPWDVLIKKYETDSLKLWYSTYFKKPRIIATDNRTVPKHFVNVKNYENLPNKDLIKADVVRWLVTRSVPICNGKDNVFIIVQLTKTHCELCGLWEKKQNNQTDKMVLISQTPPEQGNSENKMYSIVKKIMFSKCKFTKQTLVETGDSKAPPISAYLPQISTNSRWRMVRLNSDFSVLSLHRNRYAIKYSDLQKVMKMAKDTSFTIVLKTPEVESNYPHPDFGMYASPDCEDLVFIGPYYHNEDHDIFTLRYVNRELIRTDVFCKMKGQRPQCSGVWLYQMSGGKADKLHTIDLTECESDSEMTRKRKQESLLKKSVESGNGKRNGGVIFTSNDLLNYESYALDYVISENFYKYRPEPVDVNAFMFDPKIYFIPNVPNMGFIVGCRVSNRVVVQWPSMRYIVKLPSVSEAIAFLTRELNLYFIRNPSFNITVGVAHEINFTKMSIFNSDMLRGYYVACSVGVILLLDINWAHLKKLNLIVSDLEGGAKFRAQRMIFDKCYELVERLFPPAFLRSTRPSSTRDLLQLIIGEVRHQTLKQQQLTGYHNNLVKKRQSLRETCVSVIKELQPLVSSKMQNAMKKILIFNENLGESKPSTSNDVICIDSEEESTKEKRRKEAISSTPTTTSTSSITALTSSITTSTSSPSVPTVPAVTTSDHQTSPIVPKITVKKIQDLKDHSTALKLVTSPKAFSILKNKTQPGVETNGDVFQKPEHSPFHHTKTLTLKKSLLEKKCSKFVIKTSNGTYMTIRTGDLKKLPLKKLQPIAPNDPVISKLNSISTKRILVPAKANGFVKLNLDDTSGSSSSSGTIVKIVESGKQADNQSSQSGSSLI